MAESSFQHRLSTVQSYELFSSDFQSLQSKRWLNDKVSELTSLSSISYIGILSLDSKCFAHSIPARDKLDGTRENFVKLCAFHFFFYRIPIEYCQ